MSYKLTATAMETMTDMPYDEYNRRQWYEVSATKTREQALKVKPAGNFTYNDCSWSPNEYEGFAVISMLDENPGNEGLTARLTQLQKELQVNLPPKYAFYYLPPESYHQTVANTLSADRYKKQVLDAGLEGVYPAMVNNAFDQILPASQDVEPIRMKMIGLSIFGTAIGMLGVFESEDDYIRITNFRDGFYSDKQLSQLDVKMTRPFIGHVTLAYIEHTPNKNQKDHLATVVNEMNEALAQENNYFNISTTGLRRYHHLAGFIKQDNYPTYLL